MPVSRARAVPAVLAAALVAAFASGCSNGESAPQKRPQAGTGTASAVAGVQQITVVTGADLRFHPSTLVVHPGKVEIILENKVSGGSGGPPHNLQVSGLPGAFVPLTAAGDVGTVTFTAGAPGRYRFVCTIHVQQGQTGTLVVVPGS